MKLTTREIKALYELTRDEEVEDAGYVLFQDAEGKTYAYSEEYPEEGSFLLGYPL
jgi:hypothetical protein